MDTLSWWEHAVKINTSKLRFLRRRLSVEIIHQKLTGVEGWELYTLRTRIRSVRENLEVDEARLRHAQVLSRAVGPVP